MAFSPTFAQPQQGERLRSLILPCRGCGGVEGSGTLYGTGFTPRFIVDGYYQGHFVDDWNAVPAGTYRLQVSVSDDVLVVTLPVTLVVAPALGIPPQTLPSGQAGVSYQATVTASGGVLPEGWFVAAGQLPPGLSLQVPPGASNTATVTGTPYAVGSYAFTLEVSDGYGGWARIPLQITIQPGLVISPTVLTFTEGQSIDVTLGVTGGTGPYTWSAAGLPSWVTLYANGALVGTAPTTSSIWKATVTVRDSTGKTATATLTLVVQAPRPCSAPTTALTGWYTCQ